MISYYSYGLLCLAVEVQFVEEIPVFEAVVDEDFLSWLYGFGGSQEGFLFALD